MIGKDLGPYRVLAKLGEGGMGEVYRARDARLGRDVAIKVLPSDVAGDADRRARFEREARAVATLSHPNILALHDIGLDGDQLYVVTELLEGQTLAERIAEGPLPLRKAVVITIEIARGLAAAHGKGIAHRDLKPANVFLLADGQVKILDFGLAKPHAPANHLRQGHGGQEAGAYSDDGGPGTGTQDAGTVRSGAAFSPATITSPVTMQGVILGTAGYMAPEQVRGQPIDGRADCLHLASCSTKCLLGSGPSRASRPSRRSTRS